MARRLADGSIQLSDGRIIYANTVVLAQDLPEILALLSPPPAWPFVSGGGGGGLSGPQGAPGAAGAQGPPGPECIPARTLFVAKSWPLDCDPTVFFTSIQDAMTQAATLTPVLSNPVAIIVYPGAYTEDVTLVSNVSISSADHLGAFLNGDLIWTPGAGVNASQTSDTEFPTVRGMVITGQLNVDATGKTAGLSTIELVNCELTSLSGSSVTGRGTGEDSVRYVDCLHVDGDVVVDDADIVGLTSLFLGVTGTGTGALQLNSGQTFSTLDLSSGYLGFCTGVEIIGTVVIGAGGSFFAGRTCTLFGGLSVAGGSSADIRNSEYFSPGALAGPGPIDRTLNNFVFGPTAVGPNVVVFSVPYLDGLYNASLTDTGAGGGGIPAATIKLASGFTLVDTVGGRTFDISILKV